MHNLYDYEDEYPEYDEEEQFQKIKKKNNHRIGKTVNQKAQIRQQRKEKNKNREELEKQEKYFTQQSFIEDEEEYENYKDDWE